MGSAHADELGSAASYLVAASLAAGRGNFPGCKALKTHETWKLSPSYLRAKRRADQFGSAASAHPTLSASQTPANGRPASNPCGARRRNAARRRLEYG